jgi:hypothetical protein
MKNLMKFVLFSSIGAIAMSASAQETDPLAAKIFFPTAKECAVMNHNTEVFYASLSESEAAAYKKSDEEALLNQEGKGTHPDTFLKDMIDLYQLSDKETVLNWVKRERRLNCIRMKK